MGRACLRPGRHSRLAGGARRPAVAGWHGEWCPGKPDAPIATAVYLHGREQPLGVGQRHGVGEQFATGVGIAHRIWTANADRDRDYQRLVYRQRLGYPLPLAKPDGERVSQRERVRQPGRLGFALTEA